jgi:DMSO reductase anchor subunit
MPTKKKLKSHSAKIKTEKKVIKPHITSSNGPTYDTQMIVTILLLLFVYPLGLMFMWVWMHTWPVWLKLIISIPFLLGLLVVCIMFYFIH